MQNVTTAFTRKTIAMYALLGITAALIFAPWLHISNDVNAICTLIAGFAFLLLHGSVALGWRNIIAFVLITYVWSFTAEALGVATGLVFGAYHYSNNLGPKVLGVPITVQVGYVAVGYASLIMARAILGLRPAVLRNALGIALAATFFMVSWDVSMDPYQSTVSGDWLWHNGGPYFGIPVHNYVGWFGTVLGFMVLYQLYAARNPEKRDEAIGASRLFWALPVAYYALMALGIILTPLVGGIPFPFASPQNYGGTVAVLGPTLSLIAFFAMGTPVVCALLRLGTRLQTDSS